jgi:hypothetical protein
MSGAYAHAPHPPRSPRHARLSLPRPDRSRGPRPFSSVRSRSRGPLTSRPSPMPRFRAAMKRFLVAPEHPAPDGASKWPFSAAEQVLSSIASTGVSITEPMQAIVVEEARKDFGQRFQRRRLPDGPLRGRSTCSISRRRRSPRSPTSGSRRRRRKLLSQTQTLKRRLRRQDAGSDGSPSPSPSRPASTKRLREAGRPSATRPEGRASVRAGPRLQIGATRLGTLLVGEGRDEPVRVGPGPHRFRPSDPSPR